ncbi:MAG: hypothetical protein M3O01_12965, partial [Pseudomonadota bacterium]|nr:hypothetical protein [Pseudomonadota bacterium]
MSWTVAIFTLVYWWQAGRLGQHREQAAATGAVRLSGVKDTLAISFRQLQSLPLDLSRRQGVADYVAEAASASSRSSQAQIQLALEQLSADFGLPLVALIDREGRMVASSSPVTRASPLANVGLDSRAYFIEAMKNGAGIQYLLGRATHEPGLYFATRILLQGQPVGVAFVKQDVATFNRLLSDADGARVFVTDNNGVIVLANHPDMLMRRLPGASTLPAAVLEAIYQARPQALNWEQTPLGDDPRSGLATRLGEGRFATLSSSLDGTPFKVWVLEPLEGEARITHIAGAAGLALWATGGGLIWLSWRRRQLQRVAMQARRDTYELTQALPLTVFRFVQPARGAPRFTFVGRGVESLFGVDAAALERDPLLPWRAAGT